MGAEKLIDGVIINWDELGKRVPIPVKIIRAPDLEVKIAPELKIPDLSPNVPKPETVKI